MNVKQRLFFVVGVVRGSLEKLQCTGNDPTWNYFRVFSPTDWLMKLQKNGDLRNKPPVSQSSWFETRLSNSLVCVDSVTNRSPR